MNSLIATVEDCPVWLSDDGWVRFCARARIDTDGIGPDHGDQWHQGETSLHVNGHALNADLDRFFVLPPQIIAAVGPVVLGCKGFVSYNGILIPATPGDVGPGDRLGEIAWCLANDLGIPSDPNRGGIDDAPVVYFCFKPGVAAPGYALQSS